MGEQQVDDLLVAGPGGQVQWRGALVVHHVARGLVREQHLHHISGKENGRSTLRFDRIRAQNRLSPLH